VSLWDGNIGSKTTFIDLIHWASILKLILTINNFTGFEYLFEETAPVIYGSSPNSLGERGKDSSLPAGRQGFRYFPSADFL
jgi:hypothetical protein